VVRDKSQGIDESVTHGWITPAKTVEMFISVFWPGVLQSMWTKERMTHSLSFYGFIANVEHPIDQNMISLRSHFSRAVVAHAFNLSTWEAETGRFLSSRPAWSTKWVPGQPGLHRETLSWKRNNKKFSLTLKHKQNQNNFIWQKTKTSYLQ
jgi:hypothetical protein